MKLLKKQKLATRISILTSIITIAGLILLWGIVANNASSTVKTNITNQMTDAVKSRAAIINNYVASAEEYMSRIFYAIPKIRSCLNWLNSTRKILQPLKAFLKAFTSPRRKPVYLPTPLKEPLAWSPVPGIV